MSAETERYAKIADDHAAQLEGMLKSPAARQSQYDRQTPMRIEYALRWVKRVARAIRECDPNINIVAPNTDHDFQQRAQGLLRKLRPTIANSGTSMWRSAILEEIDSLLGHGKEGQSNPSP